MATTEPDITLQLRRTIPAPRERVFQAWTEAEALKRWFCPDDRGEVVVTELDARVGGRYRVEMRFPEGTHTVSGSYREVSPPERLVFTWSWEERADAFETRVVIELHAQGDATELVLTHERFPNAEEREKHTHGWEGCLNRLPQFLARSTSR